MYQRKSIPIADPQASYSSMKVEVDAAIQDVLHGPSYILGDVVARFEQEFAAYVGVAHGIGVNNGTDALHLALRALGVGPGDEVITVSLTSVATVAAIGMAGATPVLADVDPITRTIDPVSARSLINSRTKALIAVHLYGHPVDLGAITEICDEHGIALIEDCAQAHGGQWKGGMVGSFGKVAAFSFYPTKNLGAIGDAGMAVTNDPEVAAKLQKLRQYGWETPQYSVIPGWNSRLDPLQACILSVKLKYLNDHTEHRRRIAKRYDDALAQLPLIIPSQASDCKHVYHLYVIELADTITRDALRDHLTKQSIMAGIHYPYAVHQQPAYRDLSRATDLERSERLVSTILSLPMYPELSEADQQYVIEEIFRFFAERK